MMDGCQEKALELKELSVNYGLVPALRSVSLHVKVGEIAALLGANGAGKTTSLKAIYGLIPILEGELLFFGEPIKGLRPYKLVERGMSLVAQERAIFAPMSVMDNLILGGYCMRSREKKEERKRNFGAVFDLFPVLQSRKKQNCYFHPNKGNASPEVEDRHLAEGCYVRLETSRVLRVRLSPLSTITEINTPIIPILGRNTSPVNIVPQAAPARSDT